MNAITTASFAALSDDELVERVKELVTARAARRYPQILEALERGD